MNSGGFCDICKKIKFEIPVIHSYMKLRLNCDLLEISANLKGYFYINPKLLIETLMRHCLNNFYQKV